MSDKLRECPWNLMFNKLVNEMDRISMQLKELGGTASEYGFDIDGFIGSMEEGEKPVCTSYEPKHETVEQWEDRKGETYPDDGPVWLYSNNNPTYHKRWLLKTYKDAKSSKHYCKIIVANHHGKPETE